jgi:hypothetical protein
MGGDVVGDLMGIVAGHIFFFFHDVHSQVNGGTNYLECPRFMRSIFGENERVGPRTLYGQTETRPGQQQAQQDQTPRWTGRGNRLGSSS